MYETVSTSATLAELRMRWPVLLGAMLGIGVGIIALPTPAIGVFMRDLQHEFGWTRAELSLGPTLLIATLAIVSPLLGWLADRISAALIATVSLSALATALFLFSKMGPQLWIYYAGFAGMALTASGAATVVYARVVSANFVKARGLALGLAMTGNGITAIVLPMYLVPYAASAGWRSGFIALATLVASCVPVVALLMSRSRPQAAVDRGARDNPARGGQSFASAIRDPIFWLMALTFALIPLAAGGLHLHFLSYLSDAGFDPKRAGAIASLGGVSLIVGRVLTGWLIDRAFAPYVAAAMMATSSACIVALATIGAPVAVLGALAMGLSVGAEIDLIGYLTARYFGMRAFGRIYGLLYTAVLIGSACSPVAYGVLFDMTHSYATSLYAAAALLAVSACLFLTMRRFTEVGDAEVGESN
jgi:MFS family permease